MWTGSQLARGCRWAGQSQGVNLLHIERSTQRRQGVASPAPHLRAEAHAARHGRAVGRGRHILREALPERAARPLRGRRRARALRRKRLPGGAVSGGLLRRTEPGRLAARQ
jgi:hypothetical protein